MRLSMRTLARFVLRFFLSADQKGASADFFQCFSQTDVPVVVVVKSKIFEHALYFKRNVLVCVIIVFPILCPMAKSILYPNVDILQRIFSSW